MITEERVLHRENHQVKKKEAFEKQQAIMGKIYESGFSRYVGTLPRLAEAFDLEENRLGDFSRCICCMDEGTPQGIHSAGSGLLLSPEDLDLYMRVSRPDAISSHDGCGAGKIYCRARGLPEENSDQIAREWAEAAAKKYNLPHRHIAAAEMARPSGFHDARVCYYDITGKVNHFEEIGLPKGFVIGRAYMNKKNCLAEAGVALNIIFGDHGYGDLLTADNPFVIVAIAWDKPGLEELEQELAELEHPYGSRVSFSSFLAPLP